MKKTLFVLLISFCHLVFAQESTVLKGDYLGQPLPGDTPLVFASGIVSMFSMKIPTPQRCATRPYSSNHSRLVNGQN